MKIFKIVLYDEAIADFGKALEYYRNVNSSTAKKFYTSFNTTLNDLKKNPFYQIRYDNFRLRLVKKFPYILHFIVDEETKTVYVYGVRNAHQNPETTYFKK